MEKVLAGKTALVTGAAGGLGRAQAIKLASNGASVVLFDLPTERSTAGVQETLSMIEAQNETATVSQGSVQSIADLERAVQASIESFGRPIDLLVANAATDAKIDRWDMSEDDWTRIIDVNLSGVWRSCKAVVPGMKESNGGRIVIISSCVTQRLGREEPAPAYTASKSGVIGLARALAAELGEYGITCNCVSPGNVSTSLNAGQDHSAWIERQTLKDTITPEDIAEAVLYLSTGPSRMVSGVTLSVDGGFCV